MATFVGKGKGREGMGSEEKKIIKLKKMEWTAEYDKLNFAAEGQKKKRWHRKGNLLVEETSYSKAPRQEKFWLSEEPKRKSYVVSGATRRGGRRG